MFFLVLTLMVLGAASMNAQVTIGKDTVPHAGAVLDLRATNQGLKLPTVSLNPDLTEFVLTENGTSTRENAVGIVVYNTNLSVGAGLYTWNGSTWIRNGNTQHGIAGPSLTASVGYDTWTYPGTIGTWTIQNSREGQKWKDTYPGQIRGERGYYYRASDLANACPTGWHVPSSVEWTNLFNYLQTNASTLELMQWFGNKVLAGRVTIDDLSGEEYADNWGYGTYYWSTDGWWASCGPNATFRVMNAEWPTVTDWGFAVRCAKDE